MESPLTVRERDILRAAGRSLSSGEIAAQLHVAQGTVDNHLSSIIRKLRARNRLEAVRIAEEKGWI